MDDDEPIGRRGGAGDDRESLSTVERLARLREGLARSNGPRARRADPAADYDDDGAPGGRAFDDGYGGSGPGAADAPHDADAYRSDPFDDDPYAAPAGRAPDAGFDAADEPFAPRGGAPRAPDWDDDEAFAGRRPGDAPPAWPEPDPERAPPRAEAPAAEPARRSASPAGGGGPAESWPAGPVSGHRLRDPGERDLIEPVGPPYAPGGAFDDAPPEPRTPPRGRAAPPPRAAPPEPPRPRAAPRGGIDAPIDVEDRRRAPIEDDAAYAREAPPAPRSRRPRGEPGPERGREPRRRPPEGAPEPGPRLRRPSRPAARALLPFSGVERLLAGRYLRTRRKEGFISVIVVLSLIGITLGVATLIVVMSVMNGFRAELVRKIVGVNPHMTVLPIGAPFEDYAAVAQRVAAVPGVVRAAPLIEGQAFVSTRTGGFGVLVRGLSQADLLSVENVAQRPEASSGSLSGFESAREIALGDILARKLGVQAGDKVTMLSPQGPSTPFGRVPRRKSYTVGYVFKAGMYQFDQGVVFMPLGEAQKFFNKPGVVDAIETGVATPEDLSGYREDIEAAAGRPVIVDDWMRTNASLIGALRTERSVMFLILSLLILIASLIIISGLIMLVKEKGPNIAILRTMGMSRGAVMRVFFMAGATIGLVGTALGVVLGLLFVWNIDEIKGAVEYALGIEVFDESVYILSKLPAQLHWEDVGFTVAITLGLSFLATLYPAWRAAKMDPVEALRHE